LEINTIQIQRREFGCRNLHLSTNHKQSTPNLAN